MKRSVFLAAWVVAVVAGAWLRLDQLLLQVLIEDEWHPVHQVIYLSPLRILSSFGNADYSIPLVLLYFAEHSLFGLSELGLRLPLVIAGIATVAILPLVFRRGFDDAVVSMFALLLALSPFLVSYSRIARSYAMTLLGVYLAFWCLERALRGPSLRWGYAAGYSVLCGVVVWAHPVTGPILIAPLVALWLGAVKGSRLERRIILALTALSGASMALAVLPPLLGDPQALAGKAGIDQIGIETVVGAWYLWLGTGSTAVALAGLGFASVGIRRVWMGSPIARWIVLGSLLTTAILLVAKPWWVDRPLAFARYLLPLVPVILLSISAGLATSVDYVAHAINASLAARAPAVAISMAVALALWLPTTPHRELLRFPNSYTQHSFFQLDYRTDKNPIRVGLAAFPSSRFWSSLAVNEPGALTIAVAPFRYSTYEWPGPVWERESRQRVIPAFLWGTCEARRFGEVPPDRSFDFRNAVHVIEAWSGFRRKVDYIAYYKGPRWDVVSPLMPHCEAWMRGRFGAPSYEDDALLVWANPPSRQRAPRARP